MHTSHSRYLLQAIAQHAQTLDTLTAARASGTHSNGVTFSDADAANITRTWGALLNAVSELEPEFRS